MFRLVEVCVFEEGGSDLGVTAKDHLLANVPEVPDRPTKQLIHAFLLHIAVSWIVVERFATSSQQHLLPDGIGTFGSGRGWAIPASRNEEGRIPWARSTLGIKQKYGVPSLDWPRAEYFLWLYTRVLPNVRGTKCGTNLGWWDGVNDTMSRGFWERIGVAVCGRLSSEDRFGYCWEGCTLRSAIFVPG